MKTNTEQTEKLMRIKRINRWIERGDVWVTKLQESFAAKGSPLANEIPPSYAQVVEWFYASGIKSWLRSYEPLDITLPTKIETTDGARCALAFYRGLREAAAEEFQQLMLESSEPVKPSKSDDKTDTRELDCLYGIEPKKTEPAQGPACSDAPGQASQ